MRAGQRGTIGVFALTLAACSSDVTESLTTTVGGSDSSTSDDPSTSVTVTAASMSVSDDGNSISAGSEGDEAPNETGQFETGGTSGNGDAGSEGTQAESESGGGESNEAGTTAAESTGSPVDCAPFDEDACDAAGNDCMVIVGAPLVHESGPWWCIGDEEFVGCAANSECDRAETLGCAEGGTAWVFPNGCLPSGWDTCGPPGNGDHDACG